MTQAELDDIQAVRARRRKIFSRVVWLIIGPLAILIFSLMSAQPKPPAHVRQYPVSACAEASHDQAVLGDGGSIAPLCGQTP